MRFHRAPFVFTLALSFLSLLLPFAATISYAQETTGGLQGNQGRFGAYSKLYGSGFQPDLAWWQGDPDGQQGQLRFANLPPGPYVITVTAKGFSRPEA